MISTAEAPSEICDDVPAVCRPSGSTDLRPARPSSVVSRRPWSVSTSRVSPVGLPSSPSTGASIGAISRLNRPSSTATRAFCCDARPKASRSLAGDPAVAGDPVGASNWLGRSMSQSSGRGSPRPAGTLPPSGMRDIASTPQAMPTSMVPAAIMSCDEVGCTAGPSRTARRSSVPPVCWGSPACSQARRTMPLDCSPAWVTHAADDLLDELGVDAGAREHLRLRRSRAGTAGARRRASPCRLPSGVRTASTITGLPMVRN